MDDLFMTDCADARAGFKHLASNAKGVVDRALIAALFAIFNRMVKRVEDLSREGKAKTS